jgi:hypothetical protein
VVIFLLVVATVVDGALAALLIGVSGFWLGGGPESAHAGALAAVAFIAAVVACLAAPIAGFVFNKRSKTGLALAVAWLPAAGALLVLMMPAPY